MTTINLGKIAFSWKGAYAAGTTYARQDVVSYNGDSFVCTVDATVSTTPTAAGAKWSLFAQGTQGVSNTVGDVVYNSGAGLAALPVGTAGQVLSIGSSGLPVWATPDVRSGTKVKKLPENGAKNQNLVYRHYGAIMTDNSVRVWGINNNNVLGDGTVNSRSYPSRVAFPPPFPGASKLYFNYNNNGYVIDLNGQLWVWGANATGQCGTGNVTAQAIPYNASTNASNSIFGKTVTQVAMACGQESNNMTMVLCSDGTVHACGYNGYGQLGQGDTTQRNNFVLVPVISGVTKIALGREYYTAAFAVQANGSLYAWGYNGDSQLGTGTVATVTIPTLRNNGSLAGKTVVDVSGGYQSTMAIDSTGGLHAWGTNNYGQLGNGNITLQNIPVQVATGVAEAFIGTYDYSTSIIKKTDGTWWVCGAGNYGANLSPTLANTSTFAQVLIGNASTNPIVKIVRSGSGSYNWMAALLTDGTTYTWGYNGDGALCVGDVVARSLPALVPIANRTVVDIAAFNQASEQTLVFLLDDGSLLVGGYGGSYCNTEDRAQNSNVPFTVQF